MLFADARGSKTINIGSTTREDGSTTREVASATSKYDSTTGKIASTTNKEASIKGKVNLTINKITVILELREPLKKERIKNQNYYLHLLNEKVVIHNNSNTWLLFVANFELCVWN